MNIVFKPIDIKETQDLCIAFREDAFLVSFGDLNNFYGNDGLGAERYIATLKTRLGKCAQSCVHVWLDEEIIGQVELRMNYSDPEKGYVNLMYLAKEYRGMGIGALLDNYATNYFEERNCRAIDLNVSFSNLAAIQFYKKNGWTLTGTRTDCLPNVAIMSKELG